MISGGMLVALWVPRRLLQHAPTSANLNVFRDWAQLHVRNFPSACDIGKTQNSMNYNCLVHVGATRWATNVTPLRMHIPAKVTKQHEFPVFGDDRRVTLRK